MLRRRMNDATLEIYEDTNENVVLSIVEKLEKDTFEIELIGEINNDVAHDFEDEIMAAISVCQNIRLNFEKVTYISSFALKALLSFQQLIDDEEISCRKMVLYNISKSVKETFEEIGFDQVLSIE